MDLTAFKLYSMETPPLPEGGIYYMPAPHHFSGGVPQRTELISGVRKPPVYHFMVCYSDTTFLLLPQPIKLHGADAFYFFLASHCKLCFC